MSRGVSSSVKGWNAPYGFRQNSSLRADEK